MVIREVWLCAKQRCAWPTAEKHAWLRDECGAVHFVDCGAVLDAVFVEADCDFNWMRNRRCVSMGWFGENCEYLMDQDKDGDFDDGENVITSRRKLCQDDYWAGRILRYWNEFMKILKTALVFDLCTWQIHFVLGLKRHRCPPVEAVTDL